LLPSNDTGKVLVSKADNPRGLDRPLFLLYNGVIMKKLNPIKLQVISSKEIYYTFPHWESKEIDGVEFLAVCKHEPSHDRTQQLYYLRKDSMVKVK
jgi:hypothetical protein